MSGSIDLNIISREESYSIKDILEGTEILFQCNHCGALEKQILSEINSRLRMYPESHGQSLHIEDDGGVLYQTEYWTGSSQYKIFVASLIDIDRLMNSVDNNTPTNQTLRQLCFIQVVTIFEAYLSDLFQFVLFKYRGVFFKKLLSADNDIGSKRYTLLDISNNSDIVYKEAKKYLSAIVYHNISRVNFLYKNTFGVEIKHKNIDEQNILFSAIDRRHDFVHRNGVGQDGRKVLCEKEYIIKVMYIVAGVVDRLECDVKKITDEIDGEIPF